MRIVAGVDWSEESFAAVKQVGLLYRPDELVIVHGVDLGLFQSPVVAQALNVQGYDDFRRAMIASGRQVVDRARTLAPADIPKVETVCELEHAASFIVHHVPSTVKLCIEDLALQGDWALWVNGTPVDPLGYL